MQGMLRKSGFTYSACRPFAKNKTRIRKFKETRNIRHVYQNKLDKTCYLHDMANGTYRDPLRRTAFDKVLCDKAFGIASNSKYGQIPIWDCISGLKFFGKKSRNTTTHTGTGIGSQNQQLTNELHRAITKKFKKCKIYCSFRDNIWDADLADVHLISKYYQVADSYCVL